jgi:hypothetical protein
MAHTHTPKQVCKQYVTLSWNRGVHTDTQVTANRPDTIIKNKIEKMCILIDIAIPTDRNSMENEAENTLKYKSLCIEIQQLWNMKLMIIPVITGATRIVTKGSTLNLPMTTIVAHPFNVIKWQLKFNPVA